MTVCDELYTLFFRITPYYSVYQWMHLITHVSLIWYKFMYIGKNLKRQFVCKNVTDTFVPTSPLRY